MKSWLFADQLEHPEEIVLHRPRESGGLGLYNVKYRAMAELIRSFLETAVHPSFITNQYHHALYLWHVESARNIPQPPMSTYLSEELFTNIRQVKEEGLLRVATLSIGSWYKVLIENNITMTSNNDVTSSLKPCKAEVNNPGVDWPLSWRLASLRGLSSDDQTFLWRMLHNILPTQERLHRMGLPNAPSPNCTLCDTPTPDQLQHSLLTCPQNMEVADWLLDKLRVHIPALSPQQLVLLDFGQLQEDLELPITWLVAQVLGEIWKLRKDKKAPRLFQTRAMLEAGITIMRKTIYENCCTLLETFLSS